MKMVNSLLLATAAGLVAVSGAQAADLPVKAKPVEYVKVCSLYGAGFYYIPGTDICMKIGGYVRWQQTWNPGATISAGPHTGTGGRHTRVDSVDYAQRTRAIATFDTRQQTPYGTLRTYLLLGFSQDSTGTTAAPAVGLYATRAFIQIAGFTFGKATSFFDFASTAAVAYNAGLMHTSDTGDGGQMVAAYTAQFGNGVSATIAVEESRRGATWDTTNTALAIGSGANPGSNKLGGFSNLQDIVGNLRIDQAWGSAQVAVALHDASGGYYGATENLGHPGDKWGYAVMGGLRLNAPMIGPGDYFQGQVVYSEGALRYAAGLAKTAFAPLSYEGQEVAYGIWTDSVYGGSIGAGTASSVELTTAWSIFGSYEHFWTPSLRTSVYGSYVDVSYNSNAQALICANQGVTVAGGCNQDFQSWNIGSRTQWNISKSLYVGLDVIYMKLQSAQHASTGLITLAAQGAKPASAVVGPYRVSDQDAFSATWRIHRDIVP